MIGLVEDRMMCSPQMTKRMKHPVREPADGMMPLIELEPHVMCDAEESTQMVWQDTQAMLLFADRWLWFPGAQIGADSEFEWRDNRVYLLEPDGSAVEGIVFVGEIAPD